MDRGTSHPEFHLAKPWTIRYYPFLRKRPKWFPFNIIINHINLSQLYQITKLSSICMTCGNYAYFSQRLTDDKTQILVGESGEYEARCRKCFKP